MDSTSSFGRDKDDAGNIQAPNTTQTRKESERASGATSKVKRILPPRSDVWQHYTRTTEDRNNHLALGKFGQKISKQTLMMKGDLRRQS
uniref:Uncharacterized protein n=1 Tax=Brassica oleracea TaxID=3712 RepID=A0A3P6DY38_BRAOL|nr:unnamed protein product [Brassica oleracea]